jgi:DNA-binding transcriptional ArsR family regulator
LVFTKLWSCFSLKFLWILCSDEFLILLFKHFSFLIHVNQFDLCSFVMSCWFYLDFAVKFIYTLTGIYVSEYIKRMESVFEIVAEPNRRAILGLLVASEQSVGEIERQLRMPQPMVSKHLRVLRDAGFVEATVDAQRRLYRLKPEPFQELDAWLSQFRRFWSAHVDALERYLDRMDTNQDQAKSIKGKAKKKATRRKPQK